MFSFLFHLLLKFVICFMKKNKKSCHSQTHRKTHRKITIFRRGNTPRRPRGPSGCVLQAKKKLKNRSMGLRESRKLKKLRFWTKPVISWKTLILLWKYLHFEPQREAKEAQRKHQNRPWASEMNFWGVRESHLEVPGGSQTVRCKKVEFWERDMKRSAAEADAHRTSY